MRRVWGRTNSSNVMKVLWLLHELDLPFERTDLGGPFGGTGTAEYRAMNPNGTVPTLQEDGFTLWESNAILRYLCAANAPGHPFWPTDPRARAAADHWMDWQQTVLNRPQTTVFQGLVRTAPEARDATAINRALEELAAAWSMLDAQIGRAGGFVAGPEPTLADIPVGVHVHRWFFFPVTRPDLPHLSAWYGRLLERPAYRAHVAGPVS